MSYRSARKRVATTALLLAGVVVVSGCGTMKFSGAQPVSIESTPLAPQPAPPEAPKKRVTVNANKIEISEKIQFADNSDKILEASFSLMDEIAGIIKENPHISKILVEGHASSEGNAAHNMKLSDERAHSVMDYLVKKGVDKSRLSAKGFGSTKPIADDKTEEGREKNRRVDFTIVTQAAKAK